MGNVTKLKFVNKNRSSIMIRLEPWCDEFEIGENESVLMTGRNCEKGDLEIELSANEVTVYGIEGSICELTRDTN